MNKEELIWYFSDGSYITGEDAYNYLKNKELQFKKLIMKNKKTIDEISKFNSFDVIVYGDDYDSKMNVYDRVLNAGENLSIIVILMEEMIEEIEEVLNNDRGL